MNTRFLGKISYASGMAAHEEDVILGFEPEPTLSLGIRGTLESDLLWPIERWRELGFVIQQSDRGGQATIHNPGQLVIFPALPVRELGVRKALEILRVATAQFLSHYGCESEWRCEEPGLYTPEGKIVSLGVRVKKGFLTHGLAINVHNDLAPFQGIRACGRLGAKMARLKTEKPLHTLFDTWAEVFNALLTTQANSRNLRATCSGAPSSVG